MKANLFDTKSFSRFLELVGMSGDAEVKECILDFGKDEITLQAITALESVAIKGSYLTNNVEDYEVLGKLGIDNLGDLRKYLASFGDEKIRITKKANYLLLTGNKTKVIKVQLRDFEYIPKVEEGKVDKLIGLGKKNVFTLEKDNVEKIMTNFSLLGSKEFTLRLEKDLLEYLATSWTQHKIEQDLKVETKSEKVETTLTKYFVDVITNIKDDIKLGLNENAPIYVGYKDENMEIEWAIAPIIVEKEVKEE